MEYKTKEHKERYFSGFMLKVNPTKGVQDLPQLWHDFMTKGVELIDDGDKLWNFIGLEAYPFDFMETNEFYYHALIETKTKVKHKELESIVLPAGTYISFEIDFDTISQQIPKIYKFIKANKIDINFAFDYEEYLGNQDYSKKGQKLNFNFKLNSTK